MENKELIRHYTNLGKESNRLEGFSLEKIRTRELISRHLSKDHSLEVLDIGGASGVYSFWLSELGHSVTLIDPVPLHVEQAEIESRTSKYPLKNSFVGDARDLKFADDTFDIVLMLGPLYHLTEQADRLKALSEANRVLMPGGIIFAVTISQFASMLNGFYFNLIEDPQFVPMMQRDLIDGQHRPPNSKYFMNTIFHNPSWLKDEIVKSKFSLVGCYAIESFADYLPNLHEIQDDQGKLELLLESIRKVESEESLLGLTCHNMAVGMKST